MSQRVIAAVLIVAVAALAVVLFLKTSQKPQTPQSAGEMAAGQTSGGQMGSGEMAGGPTGGETKGGQMGGETGDGMPGMPGGAGGASADEASGPGIGWSAPRRWAEQGERPMRVATYSIPAAPGDPGPAECAVFHFGPHQGGGVEDNVARWVGQFENPGKPVRATKQVNGLEVSRVQVSGTYLAPGGPNMQSTGQKENYSLLGAIVTGPNGLVFFKLTGPAKTVEQAAKEFDGMLETAKKK